MNSNNGQLCLEIR